ncbi:Uncharacterised protein [Bordetella pertussis]|nr:Uncharacterised protein [Bordetella pertussis]
MHLPFLSWAWRQESFGAAWYMLLGPARPAREAARRGERIINGGPAQAGFLQGEHGQ